MPLGGKDEQDVLAALERNKKFLRGEIAHRVNLKFAPEIRFRADERFDEAERIEKILRTPEVRRDLEAKPTATTINERAEPVSESRAPGRAGQKSASTAARSATCTAGLFWTSRSA